MIWGRIPYYARLGPGVPQRPGSGEMNRSFGGFGWDSGWGPGDGVNSALRRGAGLWSRPPTPTVVLLGGTPPRPQRDSLRSPRARLWLAGVGWGSVAALA